MVARRPMKKTVEGRTVVLDPEPQTAVRVSPQARQAAGALLPTMVLVPRRPGVDHPWRRCQAWCLMNEAYGTHGLVNTQRTLGQKHVKRTVSSRSFREKEMDAAILARGGIYG
jgi:hypothetical protein